MVVKSSKTVTCEYCKKQITLREYIGLEGAHYTDHIWCPAERQAYLDGRHREIQVTGGTANG